MHVLFIHPNFPGQFAHIAAYLARELKWECTVMCSVDTRHMTHLPFRHINYPVNGQPLPKTFYNPDKLQVLFDHAMSIYKGLKGLPDFKPELVVGHMSYGTMLYLRNLYDCPFVGYYELLPPPFWGEGLVLRREFPPTEATRLFNATYHSLTYLHLHACDAGYTPTHYQLTTAPPELRYKLRVNFDGIEVELFRPLEVPRPTEFHGVKIPEGARVITYVSRGLESMRGFDIFMKVVKRVCDEMPDVIVLIAGKERTNYGHELAYTGGKSFKQFVLDSDEFDLSRIHFLDLIPTKDLPTMYALGDLHVYLTAPYVLSWSMMQAMSSGCVVLGSATAPVMEVIEDGKNGLLADFYDVDALAEKALAVLRNPGDYRHIREAARQTIVDKYELRRCTASLVELFEDARAGRLPKFGDEPVPA